MQSPPFSLMRGSYWRVTAFVLLLTLASTMVVSRGTADAVTSSIQGRVFEDLDRDGAFDQGEPGWNGEAISIYTPAGSYVTTVGTAADGTWAATGLSEGSYHVEINDYYWQDHRYDWVPTTTGDLWPETDLTVTADGPGTFLLGLRPITKSTDLSAPLSQAIAADGVVIESFTDAVSADEILTALNAGLLRGDEASSTLIRFGFDPNPTFTSTGVSGTPGSYTNFRATTYLSYAKWLSKGDWALFHEYGHVWAEYHDKIVQQLGDYRSYLEFRGLTDDGRLYSSHTWQPGEMIAEDFRQLFGSSKAAGSRQENDDIPEATTVPGLREWFQTTFMVAPTSTDPEPEPTADPEPTVEPEPDLIPTLQLMGLELSETLTGYTLTGGVSKTASVTIEVRDDRDGLVATLLAGQTVTDTFDAVWDRTDRRGRMVKDGAYSVVVVAADDLATVSAALDVVISRSGSGGDSTTNGRGQGGGKGKK